MKFKTPFQVKDGVIRDAAGSKVKLWGVNYYAPFNHNYFNIAELGRDHFKAIDEDLRHFKLMGVDFLRMHMYEREITTPEGNLVENHQMEVFDYLIDRCEQEGICLMLSPIAYWNTVKNQIALERQYAYWNIHSQDAFGFTNFYSVDALLWHPGALDCQERYVAGLFERRNKFSGKRLNEYSHIVAWELVNEMKFPDKALLGEPNPITPDNMYAATKSRGKMRRDFVAMWEKYRNEHENAGFESFIRELIERYFDRFWGMVERYFGGRVIRAQFYSYNGGADGALARALAESPHIDAEAIGSYLNVNGFEAENTDSANHLTLAKRWFDRFAASHQTGKLAIVSYEFDASGSSNGYPLAAIAAEYGVKDVQMAAYFTYTPFVTAPWNPGWLVHFMNIAHTPSRAAGFAAAGRIFRSLNPDSSLVQNEEEWHGDNFRIERKNDFVSYLDESCFCYSNDNEIELKAPEKLQTISGRGSSNFAECDGNGCYFLRKAAADTWKLDLFPQHTFLSDPLRGKVYRGMANRYVNCIRESPVSQLNDRVIKFKLKALTLTGCVSDDGAEYAVNDGAVTIPPGSYLLKTNG